MLAAMAWRMWRLHDARLLWKMGLNLGLGSVSGIRAFQRRKAAGRQFPAFLFISVTNRCNLDCQGCWVHKTTPPREIPPVDLAKLIRAARSQGCRFFGILGGEPLLYDGLCEVLAQFPDCYFQLFTNAHRLDDAMAARLRDLGTVTPLISIEGLEAVSDVRRGGQGVFAKTLAGFQAARRAGLVTGVATSVCASNIDELATETFARRVMDLGAAYLWYYIYRPVGSAPHPELCLTAEQVQRLRRFIVDLRCQVPMAIVDAYWDADGRALCPAAVGISHHVGPGGDLEPCPPLQFAAENLATAADPVQAVEASTFLKGFRDYATAATRGCPILDDPQGLGRFLAASGARDTSGRGCGLAEYACACRQASHHQPGAEIPERSWAYRFAKKRWFFGFGAYG